MGGRRIDDHGFWAGGRGKHSVFPEEAKCGSIEEVEGAGSVMKYEDTESSISSMQKQSVSKAKKYDQDAGYRN